MRTIQVEKRKELDPQDFIKRGAEDTDYKELIQEDCIIREGDRIVCVYLTIPEIPDRMADLLNSLDIGKNKRTEGLITQSKIFGYRPREQIRQDYCTSTAFARDNPQEHAYVCNFGVMLAKYYKAHAPEIYEEHIKLTQDKILPEWIIKGSPFTSGIINKNNPLKYHFDKGNLDGVYSNMVAFKRHCEGGHLSMPEFEVGLEIADKSITLFDGQDIVHGVTPFKLTSGDGYRYTMVYYTLKQMWNCQPVDEEIARIRKRKMEREQMRYKRMTGQLKPEDDPLIKALRKQKSFRNTPVVKDGYDYSQLTHKRGESNFKIIDRDEEDKDQSPS